MTYKCYKLSRVSQGIPRGVWPPISSEIWAVGGFADIKSLSWAQEPMSTPSAIRAGGLKKASGLLEKILVLDIPEVLQMRAASSRPSLDYGVKVGELELLAAEGLDKVVSSEVFSAHGAG